VGKWQRTLKNYRLSENTVKQLESLQIVSNKTATDLVEAAINYVHEELMLSQVLGKRIDKAS
jgi:hypothetical protein